MKSRSLIAAVALLGSVGLINLAVNQVGAAAAEHFTGSPAVTTAPLATGQQAEYQIIGGSLHWSASQTSTCVYPDGECGWGSYVVESISRTGGLDATFPVASAGNPTFVDAGSTGTLLAPLSIANWDPTYTQHAVQQCYGNSQSDFDTTLTSFGFPTADRPDYQASVGITPGSGGLTDFALEVAPIVGTEPRFGWNTTLGMYWTDSSAYPVARYHVHLSNPGYCGQDYVNDESIIAVSAPGYGSDYSVTTGATSYTPAGCDATGCLVHVEGQSSWQLNTVPGGMTQSGNSTLHWTLDVRATSVCTSDVATLAADPSEDFRSREVIFQAGLADAPPGSDFTIDYGDGITEPVTNGTGAISHTYAEAGEFTATLHVVTPDGCVGEESQELVADPVTAYAPSVHLAVGENVYPDSVDAFLAHAALVEDLPNVDTDGAKRLDSRICKDKLIALAPLATKSQLRDTRPHLWGTAKALDSSKLGRNSSKSYGFFEHTNAFPGCDLRLTHTQAYGKGAAKAGHNNSKDDGLALTTMGTSSAERKLLRSGDGTLSHAQTYVDYRPSRYIVYWLWYPYNNWRGNTNATSHVTEKHEGDWEHIIVNLDSQAKMTDVAYYQHYCPADSYSRGELDLENVTHPPVWAAKGGHASYPRNVGTIKTGRCKLDMWSGVLQGVGDWTSAGDVWRPWDSVTGVDMIVDATTQPWYGFKGAWGDPLPATFTATSNYGPAGPGGQNPKLPPGW